MSKRYTGSEAAKAYWDCADKIAREQAEYSKKARKIPAYYSLHWQDGKPTGIWYEAKNKPTPEMIGVDFFIVYHPEQFVSISEIQAVIAKPFGLAYSVKEYTQIKKKKKWWQFWK